MSTMEMMRIVHIAQSESHSYSLAMAEVVIVNAFTRIHLLNIFVCLKEFCREFIKHMLEWHTKVDALRLNE